MPNDRQATYEELDDGLYRIPVPLPGNPLKSLNSYVIRGTTRNLVIDTGFNRVECLQCMNEAFGSLGIELQKTDFFISHLHADHYGLVSQLASPSSKVYFNEPESKWFESGTRWDESFSFAARNGFPSEELRAALQNHPGFKYRSNWHHLVFHVMGEGDVLEYGGYQLRVIETPGHTVGHQCLYEPSKRLLFSGDHILIDITPNLQLWSEEGDPLGAYLESLEKVYEMDVKRVLPGHRRLFSNCKERILELKLHHKRRCDEILQILEEHGPLNAFEIASKMHWDLRYDHWEEFPISQKWFATGEALAHLQYLDLRAMVKRTTDGNGIILYAPCE